MARTMRSFGLLFASLLFAHLALACGYDVLQGLVRKWAKPILKEYRFPEKRDIKGYWLECQDAKKPCPYWTTGDYNGDGIRDYACLLIDDGNNGYCLFAIVSKGKGYESHRIMVSKDSHYHSMGLGLVLPGTYHTANDKSYGIHDPNDPDSVKIKHQAINWFQYETANAYYYWDDTNNTFKETWISD